MSKLMAVIDDSFRVTNIVVMEDDVIATDYLLDIPEGQSAFIDGDFFDNYFYPPQPYQSWLRDNSGNWQAPKPRPQGEYYWDESIEDWVNVEANA